VANHLNYEQVMRQLHNVTLVLLMGLSGLVLATEPPPDIRKSVQPPADSSCRNVTDLEGKVHSYCGSAAQWARFDNQMAKLHKGFSCRSVKGSQPLCLFAAQWTYLERKRVPQGGVQTYAGFGEAVGQMLSMSIDANGYASVK
jgi:hypothetical protein